MLQAIRDRAQSWIAWIIVAFLVVVFALWGVQGYMDSGSSDSIASVEGVEIGSPEFQQAYQRTRQQQRERLVQILGDNPDHPMFEQLLNEEHLKQQVLDALIERQVLLQAAHRAGLRLSERQVDAYITNMPAFQREGVFDAEAYEQQLRFQGLTSVGFKAILRNDLLIEQLVSAVVLTSYATDRDMQEVLRLKNQQRKIGSIVVSAEPYEDSIDIDEQMMRKYYDSHPEQFQTAERISVSYVELDAAQIAKDLQPDEQSLREYYEQHIDRFSYIDDSAERQQAEELRARIRAGESFAELAEQYSGDPGSAAQGGDLGYFGRGVMEGAFEEAVFSMEKGQVRGPVRTSFGYHIIKLTEIREGERRASHILIKVDESSGERTVRPFEKVREEVEAAYRKERAFEQFEQQFDPLNNLTYEHPQTLNVAAEELGLEIKHTELFTRSGGKGIAANPAIVDAAFSEDVLEGDNNSEPIELRDDRMVVLRVKEHEPAAVRPFDAVEDEIERRLRLKGARDKAIQLGQEVLDRIAAGESAEAVARDLNLAWNQPRYLARTNAKEAPRILERAFALPRPHGGKPVLEGVSLRSGDYAVIALYDVRDPAPDALDDAAKLAARREMQRLYARRELEGLKESLRQEADIEVHRKNL